ncbi:MAG: heparinase II/III family protein [Candidatus Eisenbacteria bacterium]|uniref:Heparinase II/III family protein n=1 Tax=Eiseniibacteriota bacterium TaxID=2212470 RepID=A0A937X9R9_UNCEI|nr:heparinase II/III family protein [Candidatus Eisenbacteria bacterium]
MRQPSLWSRARRRLVRDLRAAAHTAADGRLLQAFRARPSVPKAPRVRLAARLGEDPRAAVSAAGEGRDAPSPTGLVLPRPPAALLGDWVRGRPDWPARARADAADALADRLSCFGRQWALADPGAWHRDPLRSKPWPRRPHALIRLDQPARPGDVRMTWEPARFHHALLLARASMAARAERAAPGGAAAPEGDPCADALLRHIEAFRRGSPPFRGIHWAVGMEVAIRAANVVFALEYLRGPGLAAAERPRLLRWLSLHGLYLEHHLERHGLGFTTNHTLADHAGLAVLGRFFAGTPAGARWLDLAANGLQACLQEQVLIGGAHAEGSLPYERFALEAGMVACLALGAERAEKLRRPLLRMAAHLRDARLGEELPFIGDGDDSFFPPFGMLPDAQRRPLDPRAVLQVAAAVLGEPSLRGAEETEESAWWLGAGGATAQAAETAAPASGPGGAAPPERGGNRGAPRRVGTRPGPQGGGGRPAPNPAEKSFWRHRGTGTVPFRAGPFRGFLVSRGSGEGWLPTHGHNDLLSIVLSIDGVPVLIDPGTGGYACDRELRHRLRSTSAHSTVQLDDLEQSPLRARATFEGPGIVPGGIDLVRDDPLRVCGWHGGFGGRAYYAARDARGRGADPEAVRRSWENASSGFQHTRRLFAVRGQLCIEDVVFSPTPLGAEEAAWEEIGPGESRTTTLRLRLASDLRPRLAVDERPFGGAPGPRVRTEEGARGAPQGLLPFARPGRRRMACVVPLPGGEAWFLLLRPRETLWQIEPGAASRRYGEQHESAVLSATHTGPLPHCWRTVVQFRPRA